MPTQTILIVVVLAVLLLFMFRNGRKRSRDAANLASTLKPGAEVMTSGGIFGTIESVDDEENRIVLKTSATSHLTIHRQSIGRVVTPVDDEPGVPAADGPAGDVPSTVQLNGETVTTAPSTAEVTGTPEFGERADDAAIDPATSTGARRRPARAAKRSSGE